MVIFAANVCEFSTLDRFIFGLLHSPSVREIGLLTTLSATRGWPNPVRRSVAARGCVGSNPTPRSFFNLERDLRFGGFE